MTALIDHLAAHPDVLDREIGKEIARRVAAFDGRARDIEDKLDRLDAMFDAKVEKMVLAGYRLDLVRLRRQEGLE